MRYLTARSFGLFAVVFLMASANLLLPYKSAQALQLTNRSVQVSTAQPSATATHVFGFNYQSAGTLGSMVFEYCDNSPVFAYACNAPAGINVTGASLDSQSGNTGFSVDVADSTANKLVINRTPAASAITPSTYTFSNITNPSAAGQTIFVRITSYASADGSGSYIDYGSVAFATVSAISIGAAVPPYLQACVALSVASDCSSASGTSLNLGNLAPLQASAGTSQLAVGSNSITGYITYVLGTTMTSGNNAISALSVQTPSFPGNGQFGINLRANSNPSVGIEPSGSGTGGPTASYNTPNLFRYVTGDAIASSSLPTNFNRMTISYLVNISNSQPAGIYSSTFDYLSIAQF